MRHTTFASIVTLPALLLGSAALLFNHTADGHQRDHHTTDWLGPPNEDLHEYALTLGEQRFTPGPIMPDAPVGWAESSDDPDGNNLRLIQFTGPIQQQWVDALHATDIDIIQYIHPYTYITWSDHDSHNVAAQLPAVRWTGDFIPAYRVLPPYRNLGDQRVNVRIMLYRGADTDAAINAIEQLGGVATARHPIDDTFENVRFTLNGTAIQSAAKVPGVYSIKAVPTDGGLRGEMTNQISADNVDASNRALLGYQGWLTTIGLDGAGVVMANVDSGVQQSHPDLTNRMLPCTGPSCSTSSSGHGTHTAGIMAADASSGTVDSRGFLRGLGIAPGAQLIEQDYLTAIFGPLSMRDLMTDSFNNGAQLSSNSWGPAGTPQGYDDDTRLVDVGVRDADPDTPGNQPLSYILAFMNGYGGTSTQGSPDEAKNLFTIGSTKAQQSGGAQILAIDDLSSNTAHGPALDGRTIPHMVAPGCFVDSTETANSYGTRCGTSMAAPAVAGAAALFIEHYRNLPDTTGDPSPALIKAAFTAVAHDLAGNDDADGVTLGHPFDSRQGWGRMNMDEVLTRNDVMYFDNPAVLDQTGDQWSVELQPVDPQKPLRIMLAWTDAPGHGLGGSTPAWNNDLDLIVIDSDNFNGNNFGPDGWSVVSGATDTMNNTEGVFRQTPAGGSFFIRVNGVNINSDGVPNVGDSTDQDFAVVCYNCQTVGITCPADLTGDDDAVNVFDLLELLGAWGADGPGADLAEPGDVVNVFDLLELLSQWGPCA